ncbi:hypothetical protein TD95_004224 [Thielaviopsis punctulata]|uniref:Tricalbin n=1 Tax=Thielaviopsis punctulata TaxID=72032 RepID=A0A0F4ZCB0_9PEZI|nr:hypothetical protein TD95_004224 [Thielaviopsis punctulata]
MSAAEAQQQNAIKAAQNPNSNVTADDAQKAIVNTAANTNIPAFSFDPNASIEEKRAQAIPEGLKRDKGTAIVSDINDGSAPVADLPEPTAAGAIDSAKVEEEAEGPYTRTGWAPRFGWPSDDPNDVDPMDHQTVLEGHLPEAYYGEWYHNAAIIVFACLFSWLIAALGGSIGWVLILMAGCSTYYRTSLRRVRRNFRDDIVREMALKRLETDTESLEWINSFLVKFWPIYQPVLAQTIINSVDQVLSSATPSFLDSLKLKTFTLGSKPPRMEHVKTYPRVEDDLVIMDWRFSFTPNDTADMTARQLKNKTNPKIVLEIRVGKAMISKGLDVIVEDMAFSGIMRLKVKLQIPFPHVERIEMCFLDRPTIDYVCKPLGGEMFGFDINFIPGLESFILEQIHGNLAPMMYAPNVFPIEVAKMLAGTPVDQAVGVVAITLHRGFGLKGGDNFGGSMDPYASISLNKRQELARTKVAHDTSEPRWNETHFIIVSSFNDSLDIAIFDHNDIRKHKQIGVASFPLENLQELVTHENERLEVRHDGKPRGMIACDIRFFPVLEPVKNADGKEEYPESSQGILRYTIEQAKDLDGTKSLVGALNPYAVLHLNGRDVHQTKKLKRTNNPIWDNGSKEILITDRKHAKLGLTVKDDRDLAGDQVLGKYQIKLDDLLKCVEEGKDWFQLSGAQTGRVQLRAQWRPVQISGVLSGTGGYTTPIGVMRLHFKRATDLRNFEALGKSDPYVRVLLTGVERARTVTFSNDLNPEFNEILYVPVHSARERLTLEVMDSEKMGKDRSLGLVEIGTGDFISQDETGEYKVHDEKVEVTAGLRMHGKGIVKGNLVYTAAFYPCINVADPEDEVEERKRVEAEVQKEAEVQAAQSNGASSTEASDTIKTTTLEVASRGSSDKGRLSIDTPSTPTTPMSPRSEGPPKVHLLPQELLRYQSGLIIFRLMDAELPRANTRLQVFVDDMAYPSYTSSAARNKSVTFEEIGDCVVRELDFSRLTLRVISKSDVDGEIDHEDNLAQLSGNTMDTLKQCLNNPTILKLKDEDGKISTVRISLKYIPIKMDLDPQESINNMGTMRVDLLSGHDLPAADRNGKSDPFAKFEYNGTEVYKSKTIKKTLNPVWNENFETTVADRIGANFTVNVYDYDFADKPDFLGAGRIDLSDLEPFRPMQKKIQLEGTNGHVMVRVLFRPAYITRTRQGTSTFAGTMIGAPTRILTGVGGAPIKAVGAVGTGVVSGVGKGASFIKRGFRSKREEEPMSNQTTLVEAAPLQASGSVPAIMMPGDESPKGPAPGVAMRRDTLENGQRPVTPASSGSPNGNGNGNGNGNALSHTRTKSIGAASVASTMPAGAGIATFNIVSATGYESGQDVYVTIVQTNPKQRVVGKTKHRAPSGGTIKWDESFKINCSPDAAFQLQVKEHHTFSSDTDLGEALYFVDDSGSGLPKEVLVRNGVIVVRSSFVPTEQPGDSPQSQVRRSFLGKRSESRPGTSRETTPL